VSQEVQLLRMLEPAVRPGGLPSSAHRITSPIESQSFDSLLAHAQQEKTQNDDQEEGSDASSTTPVKDLPNRVLGSLTGLDRVDNASLRELILNGKNDAVTRDSNISN